jgi:hypothetical protein
VTSELAVQVRDILTAALDLPPASRLSFVQHASGNDQAVVDEVMRLLHLHDDLETLDVGGDDRFIGARVGAYEVVRLLGVGGMGAPYLARRPMDRFSAMSSSNHRHGAGVR